MVHLFFCRWRAVLVRLLVTATLLPVTGCVTRQPGQSDAEYIAQRLNEVLLYTEPLVASVPALVQQWRDAGIITATKAAEIRVWQQGAVTLLAAGKKALAVYQEAQTPANTQAIAQLLPEVLALMSQAVLLIYGGTVT